VPSFQEFHFGSGWQLYRVGRTRPYPSRSAGILRLKRSDFPDASIGSNQVFYCQLSGCFQPAKRSNGRISDRIAPNPRLERAEKVPLVICPNSTYCNSDGRQKGRSPPIPKQHAMLDGLHRQRLVVRHFASIASVALISVLKQKLLDTSRTVDQARSAVS
jgi:hypothetical protein